MPDARGMLQPFDMVLDFAAGEPGGKKTVRVASQYYMLVFAVVHHQGTGIRTIHRTGGNCSVH